MVMSWDRKVPPLPLTSYILWVNARKVALYCIPLVFLCSWLGGGRRSTPEVVRRYLSFGLFTSHLMVPCLFTPHVYIYQCMWPGVGCECVLLCPAMRYLNTQFFFNFHGILCTAVSCNISTRVIIWVEMFSHVQYMYIFPQHTLTQFFGETPGGLFINIFTTFF